MRIIARHFTVTSDTRALRERLDRIAEDRYASDGPLRSLMQAVSAKYSRGELSLAVLTQVVHRIVESTEGTASPLALAAMKEILFSLVQFEQGTYSDADLRSALGAVAETLAEG